MSYWAFLGIFLGIPLTLEVVLFGKRIKLWALITMGILCLLALIYTTPWDNLIIAEGVWSYGHGRTSGILIDRVPLEECSFYVLQVALVGVAAYGLVTRREPD